MASQALTGEDLAQQGGLSYEAERNELVAKVQSYVEKRFGCKTAAKDLIASTTTAKTTRSRKSQFSSDSAPRRSERQAAQQAVDYKELSEAQLERLLRSMSAPSSPVTASKTAVPPSEFPDTVGALLRRHRPKCMTSPLVARVITALKSQE